MGPQQERRPALEPRWVGVGRRGKRLSPALFASLLVVATAGGVDNGNGGDALPDAHLAGGDQLQAPPADGGAPLDMRSVAPLPAWPGFTRTSTSTVFTEPAHAYGIPKTVLGAYRAASRSTQQSDPRCNLTWPVLAGIGKVESGHARGGELEPDGETTYPILGPLLDGDNGTSAISDTDEGRFDLDRTWDRAVGPMQFIPSTWQRWGVDGNDDGRAEPSNVYDATLAAAHYLCTGQRDLEKRTELRAALFSYNHSQSYVDLVLAWISAYESGGVPVPDGAMSGIYTVTLTRSESTSANSGAQGPKPERSRVSTSDSSEGPDEQPAPAQPAPDQPAPDQPSPPPPPPPSPVPTPEPPDAPQLPDKPTLPGGPKPPDESDPPLPTVEELLALPDADIGGQS